jgi:hypothetical protein
LITHHVKAMFRPERTSTLQRWRQWIGRWQPSVRDGRLVWPGGEIGWMTAGITLEACGCRADMNRISTPTCPARNSAAIGAPWRAGCASPPGAAGFWLRAGGRQAAVAPSDKPPPIV